jgi:hypothetical protein
MKYGEVIRAIGKAPGDARQGSETNKWVVINGRRVLRITYPKKHGGDVPRGTLRSIRDQAKLSDEQFNALASCTMSGAAYAEHLINQGLA